MHSSVLCSVGQNLTYYHHNWFRQYIVPHPIQEIWCLKFWNITKSEETIFISIPSLQILGERDFFPLSSVIHTHAYTHTPTARH